MITYKKKEAGQEIHCMTVRVWELTSVIYICLITVMQILIKNGYNTSKNFAKIDVDFWLKSDGNI